MICWMSILVGLERFWVNRKDVTDYAIKFLSNRDNNENKYDNDITDLLVNEYSHHELEDFISNYIRKVYPNNYEELYRLAIKKWTLVHLLLIDDLDILENEKIEKLQEIYAYLDYPNDMHFCSIYSQGNKCPLVVMKDLIKKLTIELSK